MYKMYLFFLFFFTIWIVPNLISFLLLFAFNVFIRLFKYLKEDTLLQISDFVQERHGEMIALPS